MTIIIAGSGPAGAFAALGALEAGADVLMIDAGLVPDAAAATFKTRLAATPSQDWSTEDRAALMGGAISGTKGLAQKRLFGSDFATRPLQDFTEHHCRIMPSYALGGLSNVWGRGVEPPYDREAEHWPEHAAFLKSLRTVLMHLPFCAEVDNLAEVLPVFTKPSAPHAITAAAQALLSHWNARAEQLNTDGIHFGKTRLALNTSTCQKCGMCFYGCAYDAMWSSSELIAALKKRYSNFSYRSGVLLKRFAASEAGVDVTVESITEKTETTWQAARLILAAGAPQTTAIAMRSLRIEKAVLKNSDLIRIPFISLRRAPLESNCHALSPLTLAINRRALSKKAMVMHLFGQNPAIENAVLSALPKWAHSMARKCVTRLWVGMCFLHSSDSGRILVEERDGTMHYTGQRRKQARNTYLKLMLFLALRMFKTGLIPLPVPGSLTLPGSSVHYGASLAVDGYGRLQEHVYVADASGLPEIPAGSFTLSIMAHAHRVGAMVGAA